MNVYILTKGEYADKHIIGVYARVVEAGMAAERDYGAALTWKAWGQPEPASWHTSDGLRLADPYGIESWAVEGAE